EAEPAVEGFPDDPPPRADGETPTRPVDRREGQACLRVSRERDARQCRDAAPGRRARRFLARVRARAGVQADRDRGPRGRHRRLGHRAEVVRKGGSGYLLDLLDLLDPTDPINPIDPIDPIDPSDTI